MRKFILIIVIMVFSLGISEAGLLGSQKSGKMFSTEISTINAGSTYTTDSDFIDIRGAENIAIQGVGKSASTSATSDVNFVFTVSPEGSTFDTISYSTLTMVIDSTDTVDAKSKIINVDGMAGIKVEEIINGNSSYELYDVNVNYGVNK